MSGITRSRVKYEKFCQHCSKQFFVPEYRKDTALFCGRSCMALSARTVQKTTCEVCNTVFEHIASRANKAKYCSPNCYHTAMKGKGTFEYTCLHCKTKFLSAPSKKRKYCSRACINKSAIENWQGDFSTVRKNMKRRGLLNSCQRCGFDQNAQILGVHHKDRNRSNNSMENLEVLCPNCHSIEHAKHICHGFTE
jgi:5-methylcytosine-specific restriction endonuclease McrA